MKKRSCKKITYKCCNIDYNKCAEFIYDEYLNSAKDEIIIVNIGTNKVTGDSFGPMIGSKLMKINYFLPVYGSMENPIHAININDKLSEIRKRHKNAFIIATDACICGINDSVGSIQISDKELHPGAGVDKKLQSFGDISIKYLALNDCGLFNIPLLQLISYDVIDKNTDMTLSIFKILEKKITSI